MGFTTEEHKVRCDIFSVSGKWYSTESVDFEGCYDLLTEEACKKALAKSLYGRFDGMTAVILRPYCVHAYPVIMMLPTGNGEWEQWRRKGSIDYSEEE